jgi:hypothetical protein
MRSEMRVANGKTRILFCMIALAVRVSRDKRPGPGKASGDFMIACLIAPEDNTTQAVNICSQHRLSGQALKINTPRHIE